HLLRCHGGATDVSLCALAVSCLFHGPGEHRDLHSFPTRRSSDLCLGQTCIIDNWGSAGGYCLRQRNWDIHVFDVERTLLFWEVIPVGIRVDADSKAFAIINDVECIFWQLKCWVSNEVAMPHEGWRIAQEFFCCLRRSQARVELNWLHSGIVKRWGGGVFETAK